MIDIHADDYGYTLNTSKDILDCVEKECLDSFSIICNTSYFEQSMELLYKEIPNLKYLPEIYIHLNLVEGYCDSELLPMSWGSLFISSYSLKRNKVKQEIKKEIKRQIDFCQNVIDKCIGIAKKNNVKCNQTGIMIDSHVHTHLIPVVWESIVEVVEENDYNLEKIRNSKEPIVPFLYDFNLLPTYGIINPIKNRILMLFSKKIDKYMQTKGIKNMYMCGLMMSLHMDYDRLKVVYPRLLKYSIDRNRDLQLLLHPGLALKEEYSSEMNKEYFVNSNMSKNREIEKHTVLRIKEITNYGK